MKSLTYPALAGCGEEGPHWEEQAEKTRACPHPSGGCEQFPAYSFTAMLQGFCLGEKAVPEGKELCSSA